MILFLIIYLGLFSTWNIVAANGRSDFRLPGTVLPINYNLNLSTQLTQEYVVDGFVKIEVKCVNITKEIILHSRGLEINDVKVYNETSTTNYTSTLSYGNTTNDFIFINLTTTLEVNHTYYIEIIYQMKNWATKFGFFKKEYKNKEGAKKEMYGTQFQSTHARSAFPCFDEPGFKATFDVTLGHFSNFTAMSNMPNVIITNTSIKDSYAYDKFNTTPIMSTYLVAFALVSDYYHTEVSAKEVELQLWTPNDTSSQLTTSKVCSPHIYNFFFDYYNYSQPLNVEKMVVVPKFHTNGMENWGLITFAEWSLLDYGGTDLKSLDLLDRLYLIIAHEFNHLWIGNIVTPKWWTDLWLNEGLTTYMSVLGVHKSYANISIMDRLILQAQIMAMQFDSTPTFPPVRSTGISSNSAISKMFHPITYMKGACITKMMSGFIGETVLQTAFRTYVKKFAYKSVDENDFLDVVNETVSDLNVKDVIRSWTRQSGFPLVHVRINYTTGKMIVSQERFLLSPHTNSTKEQKWWIPITYATIKEQETKIQTVWMNNTEASKEFDVEGIENTTASLIVNWNFTGFYRVNYDSDSWKRIIDLLINNNSAIIKYSKIELINDAFTLAKAGKQNYSLPLKMIQYLPCENESLPRILFHEEMKRIMPSIFSAELDWQLMDYIRSIFDKKQLSFEPPTERNYYKKYDWFLDQEFSCLSDMNNCTQHYQAKFREWMSKNNHKTLGVDVDAVETMVCTAIRNGTKSDWDFLKCQFLNASYSAEQKNHFVAGLLCSTNESTLYELVSYTTNTTSPFKTQGGNILKGVMKTSYGRNALFRYIKNNTEAFNTTFGTKVLGQRTYEILTLARGESDIKNISDFINSTAFITGTQEEKDKKIQQIKIKINMNQDIRMKVNDWLSKGKQTVTETSKNTALSSVVDKCSKLSDF